LFETRKAIADFYSSPKDGLTYNPEDVCMTNGAMVAFANTIAVLCKPGSNILIPRPGFTYSVATSTPAVEDRYYNLDPNKDWELDFEHLKTLVNEQTAALVITKYVLLASLPPSKVEYSHNGRSC
jgi:tyrosine aminotransferase